MPSGHHGRVFQQDAPAPIPKPTQVARVLKIQDGSHDVTSDGQAIFLSRPPQIAGDRQSINKP